MEDINIITYYIYGSENSLDIDKVYILNKLPDTIQECKTFCLSHEKENENVNLATIKDGIIYDCFKGTVDELNNAIFITHNLHDNPPLIIDRLVNRDIYLKIIRAVRSILSHLSRTKFRKEIKEALRGTWEDRLNVLRKIALSIYLINFNNLNNNMSGKDIMKLIAFQIGQTEALMEGKELYTKDDVGCMYPILSPYLKRESDDWRTLQEQLLNFIIFLHRYTFECNGTEVTFIDNMLNRFTYDLKSEKKV